MIGIKIEWPKIKVIPMKEQQEISGAINIACKECEKLCFELDTQEDLVVKRTQHHHAPFLKQSALVHNVPSTPTTHKSIGDGID